MTTTLQKTWSLPLEEEYGHADVTEDIETLVLESGITTGVVTVALVGSTGTVTTIEYESGAMSDLRGALDRLAPTNISYGHDQRWGDGNGFSHVRSALLKTSISIPVIASRPTLGTWQQVVVINLDNRPRTREIVAVLVGD